MKKLITYGVTFALGASLGLGAVAVADGQQATTAATKEKDIMRQLRLIRYELASVKSTAKSANDRNVSRDVMADREIAGLRSDLYSIESMVDSTSLAAMWRPRADEKFQEILSAIRAIR